MPVMDEFKEEREKIKTASPEAKWQYFKDYYLKWVIGGGLVLAFLIYLICTIVFHKEEMLYVGLINYIDRGMAEEEIIKPFEQNYLEDTKKQSITIDNSNILADATSDGSDTQKVDMTDVAKYTYEEEQKVAMVIMIGQMDLMISGEDVIDRYLVQDVIRPLSEAYSEAEIKSFEEAGLLKYYNDVPVGICMDASPKLENSYYYGGIAVDHVYAVFTYGEHIEMAKHFLEFLGY